jgi:hypothetical protein
MSSNDTTWYGYMDAGEKSSPVVQDERLSTGNPATVYLFNLKRNEILEYKREIVEPKLRALKEKEKAVLDELKSAYSKARKGFVPRAAKIASAQERASAPEVKPVPEVGIDDEGEDFMVLDIEDDDEE